MNKILERTRDVLLSLIVAVLTRILQYALIAATPWLAKYGLNLPELATLNGLLLIIAAAVAGAGLDWLFTRNVATWLSAVLDRSKDDTSNIAGKLPLQIIIACVLCVGLMGCKGSISILTPPGTNDNGYLISPEDTPRQVYYKLKRDYKLLAVANYVVDAKHPALSAKIVKVRERFLSQLNDAAAYLNAHPEIQNVPGAVIPQLDLLQIAMGELRNLDVLLGTMPPDLEPTTATATQPK